MKILMIFESDAKSANYNIAVKMARRFRKEGEQVYIAYRLIEGGLDVPAIEWVDGILSLQPDTRVRFYKKREGLGWGTMTLKKRIRYILTHPGFMISFLINGIDERLGYPLCRWKVEEFCRANEIDMILGIAFPFDVYTMTAKLKSCKYRMCLQLDPYSGSEMLPAKSRNFRLHEERRNIKRIYRLFTTNLIMTGLVNDDGINRIKSKIIPIEFPEIDSEYSFAEQGKETLIRKSGDEISFLHAGTLYEDIRDPLKLVKIFEHLPDDHILYVAGKNTDTIMRYKDRLGNRLRDLGFLSLDEAEAARDQADILISYNNLAANQVPSKLFECINTGKPFINLCQMETCPSIPYVDGYKMACTVMADRPEEAANKIIEHVYKNLGKTYPHDRIVEKYRKCTVGYLTEQIKAEIS